MSNPFTTEAFSLLGVGLGVIGLRTSLRYTQVGFRQFQADDYMILIAAVVYSVETYLAYSVGAFWHGLANNAMTDEERLQLESTDPEFALRVSGSKTQLAGWSIYTLLLWLLKACMLCFYLRLTKGLDGYRVKIYLGFVFVVLTWMTVFFGIIFGCGLPFKKNWQIYPDPGNYCQPAVSRIDILMTVVLNVLTDFYLMSIPLPLLWKARVSAFKRAALIFCFSGGIFVTIAAILRCVYILTDNVNGAQLAGSWAVRETFVAVITTNLPMLSPGIQAFLSAIPGEKLLSWFSTSSRSWRRTNDKHTSQSAEPGSIQLRDSPENHDGKRGGRLPKSMYHITALTESEERIMGLPGQVLQQEMVRERDEACARDDQSSQASQSAGTRQQTNAG